MKRFAVFVLVAAIAVGALAYFKKGKSPVPDASTGEAAAVSVTVQSLAESRKATVDLSYPGTVAAEQETELTAGAAGTVARAFVTLGQNVAAGMLLFTIDDTTSGLTPEEGWKSAAVQQAQIAEEVARKNYALSKRTYDKDKTQANRTARDIAKLQYENAQIASQNATDSRNVRAPFAGVVTEKLVEAGESVVSGQHVATVSRTGKPIVKFYVDQSTREALSLGQPVTIASDGFASQPASITRIAPSADEATRRFLVEADAAGMPARIGSVVRVGFSVDRQPVDQGNFVVPISVLTTGQNETYLFTAEQGTAKKHTVTVRRIFGEWAEISTDLPESARIIVNGSKRVQEGGAVEVR